MNTNYLLREPSHDELRAVFGSLQRAYDRSAGHIGTLCFLLANPDRIVDGEPVQGHWSNGAYAKRLAVAAQAEAITDAFKSQGEKPTIAETCRRTNHGKDLVRRILTDAGLWPRRAIMGAPA